VSAVERIQQVRAKRPLVADLARALSLATSIDVALVRAMRAKLLDRADVTTEADLWASPLIQTRSSGEITLRTDVRAALWDELRADRTELERCWAALEAARPPGRPLRALEERLTYLALEDDRAGIEEALGTVVKAMLEDSTRRRDLSAWSARALAELPEVVRDTEAARILGTAAAGWVATPPALANLARTPESVRLAHRLASRDRTTPVAIKRVGGVLEVGGWARPRSVSIDVPTANPVLIIDEDRTYRIDLRGLTKIPVTGPEVMIGTADGRRWLLEPEQPSPNLDAIGTMRGENGSGCAYLVAPSLAVSSARHLLRREAGFSSIEFRDTSAVAARTVALDEDSDIALLELTSPISTSPLELQPDVHPGETWKVYPTPYGSFSPWYAPWRGTVATAWPGITLRSSIGEPPRELVLPGMPVFVRGKVIAHLGGEPARDGVLPATSARLVQSWIERLKTPRERPPRPVKRAAQRKRSAQRPVPQAAPVRLHLPERISTAGLLGTIIDHDERLRRVRAHHWGEHEVTIVTGPDPQPAHPDALRVSIKDRPSETVGQEFSVTMSAESSGKKEFLDVCRIVLSNTWQRDGESFHLLPVDSDSDVEIAVERLPHVPPARAYRRGIQFLIEVLERMDILGRDRADEQSQHLRVQAHLAIEGSGALDLGDAQIRVQHINGDDELVLQWIDPETDLLAITHKLFADDDATGLHTRVARALGGELRRRYVFDRWRDPLAGRFGVSETRGGRTLSLRKQPDSVVATVAPDETEHMYRPVRGCVRFYTSTDTGAPYSRRVRATGGVATCELPLAVRGRTVGAIIEDEGILLEDHVYADLDEPIDELDASLLEAPGADDDAGKTVELDLDALELEKPEADDDMGETVEAAIPADETEREKE
jgi:hypothetical protein